ncbi:MAG: nucleoside triphosphate hydrolase [Rhodobacterales bacterium]|nr:MAG: nucleoside triphosphate hydrolase [Rhodobacterales bacterium]
MRSSKSRSRGKSRNNRSPANNINRVFDSSGPEGKVRGTPQQIIDKYAQLARDAFLANDRVAGENFQQHAEHYTRLLTEAQRDAEEKRQAADAANRERQMQKQREREAQRAEKEASEDAPSDAVQAEGDSGLVETPETKPRRSRSRKPRASKEASSEAVKEAPEKAAKEPAESSEAAE